MPIKKEKKRKMKLTLKEVREIRALKKRGQQQSLIAKRFHISDAHVSRIISRDSWYYV